MLQCPTGHAAVPTSGCWAAHLRAQLQQLVIGGSGGTPQHTGLEMPVSATPEHPTEVASLVRDETVDRMFVPATTDHSYVGSV